MALCAQGFPWLTFVEVLETLLLEGAEVQKPGEGSRSHRIPGAAGAPPPATAFVETARNCNGWALGYPETRKDFNRPETSLVPAPFSTSWVTSPRYSVDIPSR